MRTTWVLCSSICVLLVAIVGTCYGGDPEDKPKSTSFTAKIVPSGSSRPDRPLFLSMNTTGRLQDRRQHDVPEGDLPRLLSGGSKGDKAISVVLKLSDENKSSLKDLGQALAAIKKAADPKRQTTVFVYLKSFSAKGQPAGHGGQGDFNIRIVRSGAEAPTDYWFLRMSNRSGPLTGVDGESVDETVLHRELHDDRENPHALLLDCFDKEQEEKTSVTTLGRKLTTIKKEADPRKQTTIFVRLRGLSP